VDILRDFMGVMGVQCIWVVQAGEKRVGVIWIVVH